MSTEETFLNAVFADPSDDGPRHVYADWLSERGDPRGELIRLQLQEGWASDRSAKKRVKELLKAHEADWLGSIGPVLGARREFRRGFVAKATAKFTSQADVERFGALPDWATIEELDLGNHLVKDDQQAWAHWVGPAMRHVRVLSNVMGRHLLAGDTEWALEDLSMLIHEVEPEEYREILVSSRFPALGAVRLQGGAHHKWLDGITTCPPVLGFDKKLASGDRTDWIRKAEATEVLELVFSERGGCTHHLTRDDQGRLTRLRTAIVPPKRIRSLEPMPAVLTSYLETLSSLQRWSLTEFDATIEVSGKPVAATPALEAAEAARLVRPRPAS